MIEVYRKIIELADNGEDFAVATIVSTEGTCPRGPGSKMVVHGGKVATGSVGGGCLEMSVMADASKAINEGACIFKSYDIECQNRGDKKGHESRADILIETYRASRRLVIFGGGHVGQALARAAAAVGMPVSVIDSRESVAAPEKFPEWTKLVHAHPDSEEAISHIRTGCYLVVMTHDHGLDACVLGKALSRDAAYIGMIAGRHKVKEVFTALRKEGFGDAELESVHTPIGIDIGAETPAEIAVSIMAEIIHHRHKASASPESLKIKKRIDLSDI